MHAAFSSVASLFVQSIHVSTSKARCHSGRRARRADYEGRRWPQWRHGGNRRRQRRRRRARRAWSKRGVGAKRSHHTHTAAPQRHSLWTHSLSWERLTLLLSLLIIIRRLYFNSLSLVFLVKCGLFSQIKATLYKHSPCLTFSDITFEREFFFQLCSERFVEQSTETNYCGIQSVYMSHLEDYNFSVGKREGGENICKSCKINENTI